MFNDDSQRTANQDLLFSSVESINKDQDFWFKLRGDNTNALIDVATPLLGLSLRIKNLSICPNIDDIYYQTIEEIKTIELELAESNYESAVIMAYRYILCAFLDEAVMSTSWGSSSIWAEQSMLSRFHDETWGGEKVFLILTKLESDPKRYEDLLAFILNCLILGFEGKYRVIESGFIERERIIHKLHEALILIKNGEVEPLSSATDHVIQSKYKLTRQLPIWSVFLTFLIISSGVFIGYSYLLHSKSIDVLSQLNKLL